MPTFEEWLKTCEDGYTQTNEVRCCFWIDRLLVRLRKEGRRHDRWADGHPVDKLSVDWARITLELHDIPLLKLRLLYVFYHASARPSQVLEIPPPINELPPSAKSPLICLRK